MKEIIYPVKPGKYGKTETISNKYATIYSKLQIGDIFCSENPMTFGKAINFVQSMYSSDRNAKLSHSGIIYNIDMDNQPISLEADWRLTTFSFAKRYAGKKVLIARHNKMNNIKLCSGLNSIRKNIGQWYPIHRLFLHMINLAHIIHWNKLVCSELTAKFLYKAELRHSHYYGTTPDHLADEIRNKINSNRNGPMYEIIFDDIVPFYVYRYCTNCRCHYLLSHKETISCPNPDCICLPSLTTKLKIPKCIEFNKQQYNKMNQSKL